VSGRRLPRGGVIDRDRPLAFRFEGRSYSGYQGDTLASALLANGVRLFGRSFKHHRPRGLLAAGVEEPNALMQIGRGGRCDANPRATEVALYEGLEARAVNCWPNVAFDVGAVNGMLGRFIPAGFYYKTFLWPGWRAYEWAIRRAAGLGRAPSELDPDRYDNRYAHCDVLVVGAGPAGLAAARAAAAGGARVILCEQDTQVGGALLWDAGEVDGAPGAAWAAATAGDLAMHPAVRILTRTTAIGYFDHNAVVLREKFAEEGQAAAGARERLWQVRAGRVVLATGAFERPLVFPGNDRPGVMLASAVRRYLGQWAVLPGERAVIFTNNDDAYATAEALLESGARVEAVVDVRPGSAAAEGLRARGVPVLLSAAVVGTRGRPALRSVTVRDAAGGSRTLACDLLAVSGGFDPATQLFAQSGGRLAFDPEHSWFAPAVSAQAEQSVGSAAGLWGLEAALGSGHAAGLAAAKEAGRPGSSRPPAATREQLGLALQPCWRVDAPGKAFIDFQNDVTADDVALAARENFVSVEHLKRYTTLGMAPDQGKTSNVNGLAIMAELTGRGVAEGGTTRHRFPFTPVPFGTLAGGARRGLFRPVRRLALHEAHAAAGAVFEEYGGWMRPSGYRRPGESAEAALRREARAVRTAVGVFDGSPLGKIEVRGPDAGVFLDRMYANVMSTLKPGRVRYGLMLNELGVVVDDGVCARLGEDLFLVGTTGAGAQRIADAFEEWLQCEWPDLEVVVAPVTTAWSVLTLSGPHARRVLAAAGTDVNLDPIAFPHMSFRVGEVAGLACRVLRVSFTGEVSYEINAPTSRAPELWDRLTAAGAAHGLEPVGVDAWMLLRTEKGYLHVGADTDGSTAPQDVGWGRVLKRDGDFVGRGR
jgi:sarcosine oxidase subunit alpha